MAPKKESSIAATDQSEALRNSLSMRKTLMAARIIDVNMKPWSRATRPRNPLIGIPALACSARVVPMPMYPCFRMLMPQAAKAGKSPTTTAGACARGVAW